MLLLTKFRKLFSKSKTKIEVKEVQLLSELDCNRVRRSRF
jgi:hypothetical protein